MRSGWPHTQEDHGARHAGSPQATLGAETSWPAGYSGLDYGDGDYRYPAQPGSQPYADPPNPAGPPGEHPYAALGGATYGSYGYSQPDIEGFGYGDPGYSNSGYDGPSAQDSGIPGTPTVRGSVESSHAYGAYHGGSGPLEIQHGDAGGNSVYQQPWDYDQPLRYDGEEPSYPLLDRADQSTYTPPSYDSAGYNGSQYSMPGVDGQGYDLSGVFGTGEFPEIGYDQPGYGRLSYDDPRYDDGSGFGTPHFDTPGFGTTALADPGQGSDTRFDMPAVADGPRYSDTRFDMPAVDEHSGYGAQAFDAPRGDQTRFDMPAVDDFDMSRLEHVWAQDEFQDETPRFADAYDTGPVTGYHSAPVNVYEAPPADVYETPSADAYDAGPANQTRFDMPSLDDGGDTFAGYGGAPVDQTSIDGMRALAPSTEFRAATTGGLLAVPDEQPMNWANETSFDRFGVDTQDAPPAYSGPADSRELMLPPAAVDGPAVRRPTGKRRGRSGDKRQWLALGAIGIVAAGAISFVVMKFNPGQSGPAHSVAAPDKAGAFTRDPSLEKQMKVDDLRDGIVQKGAGRLSDVSSAVYREGSNAPGSNPQIFMFVGGKVSASDPAANIADLRQNASYSGTHTVAAGSLGGQAACGTAQVNGESVAMCVWFDNDTFGELVSPTMDPSKLASSMSQVRPSLEHLAK